MKNIDYTKLGDKYAEAQRETVETILHPNVTSKAVLDMLISMISWGYAFGYQQRRLDEMQEILDKEAV